MAHPGGRPLKFKTPEELLAKAEEYFATVPQEEWMITGLAVHLDTSRSTLCDYDKKDEFSDTVKAIKEKIEMAYEKRGLKVGNAFDIFRLKNMGWRDRFENDLTTAGEKLSINVIDYAAHNPAQLSTSGVSAGVSEQPEEVQDSSVSSAGGQKQNGAQPADSQGNT